MKIAALPGTDPVAGALTASGLRVWQQAAVMAVCSFAACWFGWSPGRDTPLTNPIDFRAFYCAGKTLAAGADPYRVEPITSCQTAFLAASGLGFDPRHALFAPLPPFAIAPFVLLSHLDPRTAIDLWLTLSLLSVYLAVRLLRTSTELPMWMCIGSVCASDAWASLVTGQLVPVALAAILYAGWSLREKRANRVALGLAVASIEPHLAAPVWIATFLFAPALRGRIAWVGAMLLCLSLLLGPQLDVEYLTKLLESHARSELHNFGPQYSLSALLSAYGMPDVAALRLGAISYALMASIGIALGARLAARFDDDLYLAIAPAACVVFAGPFIHIHQMAFAIPLALVLLARARAGSPRWAILAAATVALAIPWQTIVESPLVADHRRLAPALRTAAAHIDRVTPSEFIEIPYTQYVDAFADRADPRGRLEKTLWKIPTWLALLALIGAGFASLADASGDRRNSYRLRSALRAAIRR